MITTNRVTATTSRASLHTAAGRTTVVVRKENDNNPVYIGDGSVTSTTGFLLRGTDPVTVELSDGDDLNVITTGGSEQVTFIATN